MLIAIPSRGRAGKQVTVRHFEEYNILNNVVVCVPKDEVRQYRFLPCEVVGVPQRCEGIAATRQWILTELAVERKAKYVLMLDDDMDFCYRPNVKEPKLLTITDKKQFTNMLNTLAGWLDEGFVHVGLSARQGNNHEFLGKEGMGLYAYRDVTRMMNAYAYNTVALNLLIYEGKIHLERVPVMEDFDLTLQLLRLGYPNRVSFEYCWNQRGSGAVGGCSTYRNAEMQQLAAEMLAKLHPGFVTVITKDSKDTSSSWTGMKTRVDVKVAWQKAYESHRGGNLL